MASHKKTKDNQEPQKRDYPGYQSMKALFRLVRKVVRPQMHALIGFGLRDPVALRGALSAPAIGQKKGSDFYYVASLPETGREKIRLPQDAQVQSLAGSVVRITFNDKAGRRIEVLAVPAASRSSVDDILRNEPGAFGVAVDSKGEVHCTPGFKALVGLNSANGRAAHVPALQQPRLALRNVCVQP